LRATARAHRKREPAAGALRPTDADWNQRLPKHRDLFVSLRLADPAAVAHNIPKKQ